MWGCVSVIGLWPTPSASPSAVVGCMLASRANHCLQTDCSMQRLDIEKQSVLLVGCCICNLQSCNTMSQRNNSESEGSSSSSDDWDGLPSPDVLHRYREPKSWMDESAQTEPGCYTGPYRGLGIPHQNAAVRSRAAAAAHGINDHARGGCVGRRAYRPRRCGLCDHQHTFDTRTGLNNHSSKQHGYYYSLKEDCFVPLGGTVSADARR